MAVVGLDRILYNVSECVGVVEVCAVVISPDINCPIGFPFIVVIKTRPDTAGIIHVGESGSKSKFMTRVIICQWLPWIMATFQQF